MEDIKNLFKKTIIVTIVCFLFGLIFQNKYLLFGISGGCSVSVIALYMLSVDTKAIIYSKDVKTAKRIIGTLNVKLTIYTMNALERIKKYLK